MESTSVKALVLAVLLCPAALFAATFTVDCAGGGNFLTIQEAVDTAANGDTIGVAPCVYEEHVVVTGKVLVFEGAGAQVTELTWTSDSAFEATLEVNGATQGLLAIRNMRVVRQPETRKAITWDEYGLTLEGCQVVGEVIGGEYHGSVSVYDSEVTVVGVVGGLGTSTVEDSRIGSFAASGIQFQAGHSIVSARSRYGTFHVGALTRASCSADSIGTAFVPGGVDVYGVMSAVGCRIDSLVAESSPDLTLVDCSIGDLDYIIDFYGAILLDMSGCLVTGDASVDPWWRNVRSRVPASRDAASREGRFSIEHNTFLGDLTVVVDENVFVPPPKHVRSNIVVGATSITSDEDIAVTHNDFAGPATVSVPGDSVYGNISAPPYFCGPDQGDYTIGDCSECVGAAHDGGDIGAFGVGCVCTAVDESSWGRIKHLYRNK